jgi:ribosomal protein S18 acetylase RimI-like enzyme
MKIRKATKKDKRNYLKIQKEAFPNICSERDSKFFIKKINQKEIFVLEEKGEYAGHLAFGIHLISPPLAKSVFIEELAISKKFRGKGFGKLLIKELEKFCIKKNIEVIYASSGDYKGNKSLSFYKKLGFKKIGKMEEIKPSSEYGYGQIFLGKVLK